MNRISAVQRDTSFYSSPAIIKVNLISLAGTTRLFRFFLLTAEKFKKPDHNLNVQFIQTIV